MVDVDGVIIRRPQGRRWDHSLERDLGISAEALQESFFRPFFRDVLLGRVDLIDRLAPVLAKIAPRVEARTLVNYWYTQDAVLDMDLLQEFASLRANTSLRLDLATVQEHGRAKLPLGYDEAAGAVRQNALFRRTWLREAGRHLLRGGDSTNGPPSI